MENLTEQELAEQAKQQELAEQAKQQELAAKLYIESLKNTHKVKEVYHLEIPVDGKLYSAFFKKANFSVACKIFSKVQKEDWAGAIDTWLMNCWLEGDTEIQEDDDLKLALIPVLNSVVGFLETSFKKK